MAEKAIKKVEDQLNCSICLDTYSDPKLLQCFHVYCQKCLVKLVVRDQQGQLNLTCPICRQVTPVPANGVAGLQPAFHINYFLEIVEEHKKVTADPSGTEELELTSLTPQKIKICCPEHGGKEVELYCETCEEPICVKCALKGGKHHDHDYQDLSEAFERYKVQITASLEPMEKHLTTIEKALTQIDTHCDKISYQQAAIETDINSIFSKLQQVLDTRKANLISQLHHLAQAKLKGLAVQKDQMQTIQARLNSCIGFMKESLHTGSQGEVLMMKAATIKQAKELTSPFTSDMLKPVAEADMMFSALADITTACQNYGQVSTLPSPDPSKCHATGKGIEAALVAKTSIALLQVVNFKGLPCEEPIESSECDLVSEITAIRTRGSMKKRQQSQYEVSYQPTIKGRHQLHIKVQGHHIRGSPFGIIAKSSVEKLGIPIVTFGRIGQPSGIAINQKGEVVVIEWAASRISVLSCSGEKILSFGTHGSDRGNFQSPIGVAVDGEGNILVADCGNHRIQKLTSCGQFIMAVGGTESSTHIKFHDPKGVAFNAFNDRLYVTDGYHRVQVLNSDFTFFGTFGRRGSGKGQFHHPYGITCDSSGKVYVADYYNDRVQVFTAEGKFVRLFGRPGEGVGELSHPIDVAVDTSGMVFVSDGGNHRVSVFTSVGGFVTSFGCRGVNPGEFNYPRGISVDNSGVVYVCDRDNNRIQLF